MLSRTRISLASVALAAMPLTAVVVPGPADGASGFPSIGTAGVEFSASVATDPQRDVGEPEVAVDNAGNVYTCGPSGFSNVADYAQVSTDGGDQFHLLGQPPRGQISVGEGGGDCGLASAPVKNAAGHYTWAYTGLGPLTNFSTATSPDTGKTLTGSAISESPPGVDRQWLVFTDEKTVFMNYNHLTQGYTVQKSTDGGLTYGPAIDTGAGGGRIGPLRAILSPDGDGSKAIVYFPSYRGSIITLVVSPDGGDTWDECEVYDAELNPSAGFVIADHDSAGNVYIAYSEKGGDNDTWMTHVPAANVASCSGDAPAGAGFHVRVNRDKVETTVMPWLVAGDEGRVAVAYFGTESVGDPDSGSFVASWYPMVSMTLDATDKNAKWSQVKATTHPFHYGSICLNGLGCNVTVPEGDRSLADYFAMDLNPKDGRLFIVYGSAAKKPDDAIGHVSTATVVVQETGPSLYEDVTLKARRPVLRPVSDDPEGDALAPYSQLYVTPTQRNQAAMDVRKVEIGPEIDLETGDVVEDGGFTVTMQLGDLSTSALQNALTGTTSQSLVYLFRFLNGFQPAGATAAWSPATGWTFGFDDFETRAVESGQADPTAEKILVWHQNTQIPGKVNDDSGVIQLSVPRNLLRVQTGPTGKDQVPAEAEAETGSRLFDGTVFTMGNSVSPSQKLQSYLYPVDNSPAQDFLVHTAAADYPKVTPPKQPKPQGPKPEQPKPQQPKPPAPTKRPPLAATGLDLALPLAGMLLLAGALAAGIRRRRTTG